MVAHVEEVQVGSDMVAKAVQMVEMADDGLIERNDVALVFVLILKPDQHHRIHECPFL